MDREITVTLTPRLIRWTLFYQLRPLLFFFCLPFLVVSFALYLQISHGEHLTTEWWISNLWYFFIPVFFGLIFYYSYSKSMTMIRKLKTPVMKYRITDEWMYAEHDLASGKSSWAVFKGLQKNAKLWRVVTQSGMAHIFPVEVLDNELREFLTAKLPAKRGEYLKRKLKGLAIWLIAFLVIMYFVRQGHH